MDIVWKAADPSKAEESFDSNNEKKPPRVTVDEVDSESGIPLPAKRPTHLMGSIVSAVTLFLIAVLLGAGFRRIAIEIKVDHSYLRLAFTALVPVQVLFTLVWFGHMRCYLRKRTNSGLVLLTCAHRHFHADRWSSQATHEQQPFLLRNAASPPD